MSTINDITIKHWMGELTPDNMKSFELEQRVFISHQEGNDIVIFELPEREKPNANLLLISKIEKLIQEDYEKND